MHRKHFQWCWSKVTSKVSQFPHFETQKAAPTSRALTALMSIPELVPCTFFTARDSAAQLLVGLAMS